MKEFFVCFTIVATLSGSFTAACPTHRIYAAFFTLLVNDQAFFDKILSLIGIDYKKEIGIMDIAQKVFVCAVKVAGINISVALADKLMRTMTGNTALFCRLTEVQTNPVIKLAYADVLVPHIVLDIEVKNFNQKIGVLFRRHIKFAVFV